MPERYWLMKSDPDTYGLEHLQKEPRKTTCWDGVRNFTARNLLRDEVQKGDGVLFYHSQEKPPGVVAIARVVKAGYPDPSQFDPADKYHDARSDPDNPRWYAVDIKLEKVLPQRVDLPDMRENPKLAEMGLLRKGNRLSVQPVTRAEWKQVLKMGGLKG